DPRRCRRRTARSRRPARARSREPSVMMTARVEPLAWDSDFFGFPVGSVCLDGATPESLKAVDAEARTLGLRCLYGTLDPGSDTTAYLVQVCGYRLVEVSQLFSRPAVPFEPRPTKSTVRRGT